MAYSIKHIDAATNNAACWLNHFCASRYDKYTDEIPKIINGSLNIKTDEPKIFIQKYIIVYKPAGPDSLKFDKLKNPVNDCSRISVIRLSSSLDSESAVTLKNLRKAAVKRINTSNDLSVCVFKYVIILFCGPLL